MWDYYLLKKLPNVTIFTFPACHCTMGLLSNYPVFLIIIMHVLTHPIHVGYYI